MTGEPDGDQQLAVDLRLQPIWQVVDGPWKLTHFDASGDVTMVPNSSYSGPVKPTIKQFQELPYTTDDAEFNALVGGKLDVGYLPFQDVTQPTTNSQKRERTTETVQLHVGPALRVVDQLLPYNFNSSADGGNAGKIFSQLYVRQAIQYWSTSRCTSRRSTRATASAPTGLSRSSRPTRSPRRPRRTTRTRTTVQGHLAAEEPRLEGRPNGTTTCASPGTNGNECVRASRRCGDELQPAVRERTNSIQELIRPRSPRGRGGHQHEPLAGLVQHRHRHRRPLLELLVELQNWGAG